MEQELSQARGELRQAQQELAQARQSSPWERLEQLERDLAAAQRAVQELRTQMTATERPTRPGTGRGPAVVAAMLGLVAVGASAALFLVVRSSSPPVVHAVPAPPAPVPTPLPGPGTAVGDAPAPELPAKVRVTARWGGAITSSSGLGLAPGTPCTVDATLVGAPPSLSVDTLEVRCGSRRLYGSSDELNGVSMTSSGAAERTRAGAGGSDAKAYEMVYQDTGDRSGARSQILLRTELQQARIWSEGLPGFEAKLRLDRLSSDPAAPVTSGRSPRPR